MGPLHQPNLWSSCLVNSLSKEFSVLNKFLQHNHVEQGSFTVTAVTGTGGLPLSPYEASVVSLV